ncbi:efflux transporter [Lactarius akahatsu]|uniref:Efflux transporter n=1 Tax=Lactarius akahatsu TaxID=416441 RepID=A0AAD4LRS9_9AGAM|nr:efflux transporter [Lactarius akahatsu]
MFSQPDLLSSEKTLPIPPQTANPVASDRKAVPDPLAPQPPAPIRSTIASVCIVATCTSSLMMSIALGPPVSVLLPYADKDLHIQKEDLQWIINAYSISSACFLLLCGRLADLYGRKRVWLAGYFILTVFTVGAGFAQSGMVLDILRGIQGLGSAALIPASVGILAKAFPPGPSRPIAFSTYSAGAAIGGVLSYTSGSVLTQSTTPTWRSPMFLFAGVSFAWMMLGLFAFEEDEPSTEEDKRVDWIGAALITAGLVLIVFVLSDLPDRARGLEESSLASCSVLLFISWQYYLERRLENPDLPRTRWTAPPLMKPSMWTRAHGRFAVMQIIACVSSAAFACWSVWVQLYYQTYLNLTPIQTMPRMLPLFVAGIAASVVIALTIMRVTVVYLVATGTLMTACADVLIAVIKPERTILGVLLPLNVSGRVRRGPHVHCWNAMGTAIGVSVSTIVFDGVLGAQSSRLGVAVDANGDNAPLSAQLRAYKAAMWTGCSFGLLGTILCVVFLRGVGIVGESGQDLSAHRNPEDGGLADTNGASSSSGLAGGTYRWTNDAPDNEVNSNREGPGDVCKPTLELDAVGKEDVGAGREEVTRIAIIVEAKAGDETAKEQRKEHDRNSVTVLHPC